MPPWQQRSGVIVGIAVLIRRGEQVLLTHRKGSHGAGTWAPPGGHLDMGESFEDCAIREVHEETGVTITEPRFLAVTNDIFVDEGRHYATIWMEARVEAGIATGETRVNSPREMSELGWFDWDDLPLPRFLAFENYLAGRCYPPHPNETLDG
ncbi:MAG TPA: NUDIX domain-containing protein [Ktedonobacterales bacterium]|jgi:8-oxo-dGTP diphosphatase